MRDNFLWDSLTADLLRPEETRSVLSVMLRAHTLLLSGNEMCNVVVVLGELLADPLCAVTRLDLGSNSLTGVNLSYLFECLADNTSAIGYAVAALHGGPR